MDFSLRAATRSLVEGNDLSTEATEAAVGEVMDGDADPALIGAFLTALRCRGETQAELLGVARAMRARMKRLPLSDVDTIDTCGTGGDGADTINISTAVAFVAAAEGLKVAKHGNRSVSSKSGSADVLEACGLNLELDAEGVARCIEEAGVGFMYAPAHHPAMRHAGPIRRALGFRTVFNLAGPLTNPALAKRQVMGVFDGAWLEAIAEVLHELGVEAAWVVHGLDGLDELSVSADTEVATLDAGQVARRVVSPGDYGLGPHPIEALRGGDAKENAGLMRAILGGKGPEAMTDAVAFNAAAALVVGSKAKSLHEGVQQAKRSLESGRPLERLNALVSLSQS